MYKIKFKDGTTKEFETLVGADLREADLEDAILYKANLKGANLEQANMKNANLRWANMEEANLRGANLVGADIRWANLKWANLGSANLELANLVGADLRWANLMMADFRGADLTSADLDFSCLPLWCGSLKMIVDDRIKIQILFHLLSLIESGGESDLRLLLKNKDLIEMANRFHRVTDSLDVKPIKGE